MTYSKIFMVFGAVAVSAALLAGCRAEEQGRITYYKPGIYLGKKDTELSEAQVRALRLRSAKQGSAVYRSGGGSRKSDVRKPSSNPGRLKKQGNP